mgnify:CR=1 FL=1
MGAGGFVDKREPEDVGDVAHGAQADEIAHRPVVILAGNFVVDGERRAGGETERLHVERDGGFLGVRRIEVDHDEDAVAGCRVEFGEDDDVVVVRVVKV